MNVLKARQLLVKAAQMSLKEREIFSKERLVQRLQEIKYLASQKKVPKITLRKEIIHLEEDLSGLFSFDEILLKRDQREAARIKALRQQIEMLRNRITAGEDKDLVWKVEKLSHLLGECLARKEIHEEVDYCAQNLLDEKVPEPEVQSKIEAMRHKIQMLKDELELNKALDGIAPEKMDAIEKNIGLLEEKLKEIQVHEGVIPIPEAPAARHVMLFGAKALVEEN
ncbi:MAG: hypothetical protein AABX37_05740 [Nanoarchaeota archaeon]